MLSVLACAPSARFAHACGPAGALLDVARAREQHAALLEVLREAGATIVLAPWHTDEHGHEHASPRSCCVGDLGAQLDDVLLIGRPADATRGAELEWAAAAAIDAARVEAAQCVRIAAPGTLEGPDVVGDADFVYVGQSTRTNHAALKQLALGLLAHGKLVKAIEVRRCAHLANACSPIGDDAWLVHAEHVGLARVRGVDVIEAPAGETYAAALLGLPGLANAGERAAVLVAASAPRTAEALRGRGLRVLCCDLSEFERAGVSPRSLVWPIERRAVGDGRG